MPKLDFHCLTLLLGHLCEKFWSLFGKASSQILLELLSIVRSSLMLRLEDSQFTAAIEGPISLRVVYIGISLNMFRHMEFLFNMYMHVYWILFWYTICLYICEQLNLKYKLNSQIKVGTYHSSGSPYQGHYSIWLVNEFQEVCLTLHGQGILQNNYESPNGWVNGNFYQLSTEHVGILPIPESVCETLGMLPYNLELHFSQTHWFVASLQNTQCPVLPIHNSAEEALFHDFMAKYGSGTKPKWQNMVLAWNQMANNKKEISYKLPEHLHLYYAGVWKRLANVKQTLALTSAERTEVKQHLTSLAQTKHLPPVAQKPLNLHHVTWGLLELDSNETMNPSPNSTSMDSDPNRAPSSPSDQASSSLLPLVPTQLPLPVSSSGLVIPSPTPATSSSTVAETLSSSLHSTTTSLSAHTTLSTLATCRVEKSTKKPMPVPKTKAPRKCPKCTGSESCPGHKEAHLCTGVCRDCGRRECKG
ncbi:hypothetical protein GYMLUDRAFT_55428 [Collybiopsis luxurians FD-317 M1]|nr:hypothetical protein GYMLUDRAFT_55428 [Collybiopsis luxurians FD-317 M1]